MLSKPFPAIAYALAITGSLVQSIAYGLEGPHPALVWLGPFAVAAVLAFAWLLGSALGRLPWVVRLVAGVAWALTAVGVAVYDFESATGFPNAGDVIGHVSLVALAALATDGMIVVASGVWHRAKLQRALIAGLVPLILLVVAINGAIVHVAIGAIFPEAPQPRLVAVLSVLGQLRDRYPHWRSAPVTFAQLVDRHRERLHVAAAECRDDRKPCPAIIDVLRDALAELDNGHVYVEWPESWVGPNIETRLVEERAAVIWADDEQIEPGDVIESVDGLSVDATLARLPHWAASGTAARTRRYDGHRALLLGKERTAVDLVLRRADGTAYNVRLERPSSDDEDVASDGADDQPEPETDAAGDSEWSDDEYDPTPLHGWSLDDGVTAICVEEFHEPDVFVDRLNELARQIAHESGTIVDLRRCRGGQLDLLQVFLSRFARRSATVGNRCVPDPTPRVPERIRCSPLTVEPEGPRILGPVAVLIGPDTGSAAEIAAHFLCSSGRARCFGETTSGETDLAEEVVVEGATVTMSIAGFEPVDGPSLLGRGVVPDEPVATTLADVRSGSDPALQAARAWLAAR